MDVHVSDNSLTYRYQTLANRLEAASKSSLVTPAHPPLLIGACKHQPATLLKEAIDAGLQNFGENKVQEARDKWPALKAAHPQIQLHLIGPLQSNKAQDAVELFDVIHTIDREKIVDAISAAMAKTGKTPKLLIQVNIGEEGQKSGVVPGETAALLEYSKAKGLNIEGLMCVPPEGLNPAPYFALLKKMADGLGLKELSMGMSSDFEAAARLGATMVRIGTALFGERA